MKESIKIKLKSIMTRHKEISLQLSNNVIIRDHMKFRILSKEYAQLSPIVVAFKSYSSVKKDLHYANYLVKTTNDSSIENFAQSELFKAEIKLKELKTKLECLLLPKDPNDKFNVFLEIRAGSGGNEAAIFAGDLFRMYSRYSEKNGWNIEMLNYHAGYKGGYKEIITKICGKKVYSNLKFESGTHRVQRIPATESQGRVHTSACTVAVMPEVQEIQSINISPSDLKIDSFRSSGAGGQHVNKTDSAIRITHLPTGIAVECQDGRSQHKNRAQAMSILKAKLLQLKIDSQRQIEADKRRILIGSGDRSERIRTYNFAQSRVTDHRINLTLYKLEEIITGNLNLIIHPLSLEYQADLLTNFSINDN